MELIDRYKNEVSSDISDIDYAVSFIKSFRTLEEDVVRGTIWYGLWQISYGLTEMELTKEIIFLSNGLNIENSLYGKYTTGLAYAEVR